MSIIDLSRSIEMGHRGNILDAEENPAFSLHKLANEKFGNVNSFEVSSLSHKTKRILMGFGEDKTTEFSITYNGPKLPSPARFAFTYSAAKNVFNVDIQAADLSETIHKTNLNAKQIQEHFKLMEQQLS